VVVTSSIWGTLVMDIVRAPDQPRNDEKVIQPHCMQHVTSFFPTHPAGLSFFIN